MILMRIEILQVWLGKEATRKEEITFNKGITFWEQLEISLANRTFDVCMVSDVISTSTLPLDRIKPFPSKTKSRCMAGTHIGFSAYDSPHSPKFTRCPYT